MSEQAEEARFFEERDADPSLLKDHQHVDAHASHETQEERIRRRRAELRSTVDGDRGSRSDPAGKRQTLSSPAEDPLLRRLLREYSGSRCGCHGPSS